MLCRFSVRNFKSIRDEAVLDMQATSEKHARESVIESPLGVRCLPIAVIYGPNGGGKSNTLEAISVMRAYVLRHMPIGRSSKWFNRNAGSHLRAKPFAFSEQNKKKPTEFDVFFEEEGISFNYKLSIFQEQIVAESFSCNKTGHGQSLFTRDKSGIQHGSLFHDVPQPTDFSKNMPYLPFFFALTNRNPLVKAAIKWFVNGVDMYDFSDDVAERQMGMTDDKELKPLIIEMMKSMDLGIDDYSIHHDGDRVTRIVFTHVVNNISTKLDFFEESAGTRKVFSMLLRLIYCLKKGSVLIFDELDAKLHPLLLRHIVSLFVDKGTNVHGAQLIFTSHDVVTLNAKAYRNDEIWFAAKDAKMGTKLYSLADFKSPSGAKRRNAIGDNYMNGMYGADPFLKTIKNLNND